MYKKGFPFLSLQLADLSSLTAVEKFTSTIWPQGNSYFSNTVWNYAVQMQELIQMIHRMILEGLGLDYLYDTFIESVTYSMRLSKYHDDNSTHKTDVALPSHKDPNCLSIIGQHKLDGLEVERSNGEWIHVSPLPNSFTVLLGEVLMAWSNGRFRAATHRVKMDVSEERYSAVYSTFPCQTFDIINSPTELIDQDHPSLYKSFNYYDYLKFRFSNEGDKHEDTLKAYCGVH
ncbi:hypothetical protein HPP92_018449 [Vanilla planifolia]|uniref:Isopenicillin N synthase-like Fe(2+) 2OG dioxygenase domain-containing protein n=1 Tax=Vanilla planifolia TaxID=51239 RepID=A0A835UKT9_VANPL|nr:hypothetical protein HPP92_018449 [Vanilla planifolia]